MTMQFKWAPCLAAMALLAACAAAEAPEQIHLTLTEQEDAVRVTWAQPHLNPAIAYQSKIVCLYGDSPDSLSSVSEVKPYTYSDGYYNGTLFTSTLANLPFSSTVYYRCGSPQTGFSKVLSLRTKPETGTTETQKIVSFGDAGITGIFSLKVGPAQTFAGVADDVVNHGYQLAINVGDSGYADDYTYLSAPWGNNSWAFDSYFNSIENFTSVIPMMSCPGNHERQYNFSGYLNRFIHPVVSSGPLNRFYYSFDWGPIHFLSYSSEHNFARGTEQWNFIQKDLEAASKRRHITPWIIVWAHRPLYCTDLVVWENRCVKEAGEYRKNIEDLLHTYGVDLHISGHNHQYERSYPVYNNTASKNFHNANATVYIVNGAAGDIEGLDPTYLLENPGYRAFGEPSLHTGYGRMSVNQTALAWDYVDAYTMKVVDTMVLTKDPQAQAAEFFYS